MTLSWQWVRNMKHCKQCFELVPWHDDTSPQSMIKRFYASVAGKGTNLHEAAIKNKGNKLLHFFNICGCPGSMFVSIVLLIANVYPPIRICVVTYLLQKLNCKKEPKKINGLGQRPPCQGNNKMNTGLAYCCKCWELVASIRIIIALWGRSLIPWSSTTAVSPSTTTSSSTTMSSSTTTPSIIASPSSSINNCFPWNTSCMWRRVRCDSRTVIAFFFTTITG